MASPVTEHAVNNGAKIKLGTKSVEYGTLVDAKGGKSCLVNLKHMSTFGWLHSQVDDWLELDCLLVNFDRLEGSGNKHVGCFEQAGALVQHDDATIKHLGIT